MPPRKRATPAKKATPAKRATPARPTDEETAAALVKSAERLEKLAEPPRRRTPKLEPKKVEAAVEKAEARLAQNEGKVPSAGQQVTRDFVQDATPVQVAGPDGSRAAQPAQASRDKLMDAQPAFSSPVTDRAGD